jgi:hypothetical protein
MTRSPVLLAALVLVLGVLAGCGPSKDPEPTVIKGDSGAEKNRLPPKK